MLFPIVVSCVDFDTLQAIGRVLSHGYLATGILPIRTAFPCLVSMLKCVETAIPDDVLQTLVDSLSSYESQILRESLCCDSVRYSSEMLEGGGLGCKY